MPRAPRLKVAAIAELFRQLEYAPPETRTRQMDATERLIADIDPRQNYPEDFIIYRITGYRSDRAEEPATLVGEALLPDLVNLVLLLSKGLRLPMDYAQRRAISLDEAAVRLGVSTKTIQRYRRRGLVVHHAMSGANTQKMVCFEDALQRFSDGHRETIDHAATYSRVNGGLEATIIEQAQHLRKTEHLSLNHAAEKLAAQHGRAHETIRQLLRRHDRHAPSPIFRDTGPLAERQIQLIHRAWLVGVEPEAIAGRLGKSKATIHRAVNRRRAELLAKLDLSFVRLPTFDLPDATTVILSAPAVGSGLDAGLVDEVSVIGWIESMRKTPPKSVRSIDAILAGYNFLKKKAGDFLKLLGRWPSSEVLDEIETNLRWAMMLKRLLVILALPAALRRIEQHLHRPLAQHSTDLISHAMSEAVRVTSRAIERVDPSRDQPLDRMVSQAMDRTLARKPVTESDSRSVSNHSANAIHVSEFLVKVVDWQWLSLPFRWRTRVPLLFEDPTLGPVAVQAINRRHGWDGGPPHTIAALSKELNTNPIGMVRLLRRAEVHLRRST